MSASRKSQITTEFVIIMIAVFLIFSILFQIYMNRQIETRVLREQIFAERIVEQLALTINAVYLAGNGTNQSLFIPEFLAGRKNYTLLVEDSIVYLFWDAGFYSYPLVVSYVFYQGNLTNRTIQIKNFESGIYLE
jgi:hypothetical protein